MMSNRVECDTNICTGKHHSFKHGQSKTRLYTIWISMKQRCFYKKYHNFHRYGGRGITVCDEWVNFEPFYEWAISHGYAEDLTLDRINNNGNYEPSNCRWATYKEQRNNSSSNVYLEYRGNTYTMMQLSEKAGIRHSTFRERLKRGWSVEDAVNRPVQRYNRVFGTTEQGGAE